MQLFTPTIESIPPKGATYELRAVGPATVRVHLHPLNPLHFVLRTAQVYPDKLAILHPDVKEPVSYSYSVWAQRIQNFAYALIRAGVQPGDRVAVIAPNWYVSQAHHGVIAARAVLCPINTRLTHGEVAYILEHSGAKIIIVDYEFKHLVEGAKVPVIVSNDTGRRGDPYEDFLAAGRQFSNEKGWSGLYWEPDENANAALCYTSGTTGRPKGVMTTLRGSYLAALANAYEAGLTRDSVYLWVLPMFHACGWTYPWSITASMATQITLRSVSNPHIWNHLLNSGVTHYCGAPTVQIGLISAPEARPVPQPVKAIIAGSAPTAQLIGDLETKGITAVHTYGPVTICYPQPAWMKLSLQERARFLARQGRGFITAADIRVVYQPKEGEPIDYDAPLVDVPRDGATIGEVVMRGNITMKEYFRDPEATRKAFRGGYFNSGDLAVMYPDGYIAIQDRSKDIIISGGENASSLAIEQELATHPDVLEVSVVARPHPRWGERPMAFVILRANSKKKWVGKDEEFAAALKKHARGNLPGFACPEWVQLVDELPKTSTGKIQKVQLRKIVAKL
ncbi:AMP-dependent synthetase and ligase [Cristinia sonorae]|uniref:AMP-dependent synthetase and ligase n=1 Tax=Cristinia sonorae TaxID=1940300 RepID=A0A8K0UWX0_9AGAR|nr:AMP-dependent synthetase and ligase [Cristinia sonorae]